MKEQKQRRNNTFICVKQTNLEYIKGNGGSKLWNPYWVHLKVIKLLINYFYNNVDVTHTLLEIQLKQRLF